ncbi:unnamed protein product [Rotaria sp. Silwood1]|nr:unnamed protein product [Rotaria sp. Silwood1]CAF1259622.1 unnamed protein product [Rotaria sp. Silwood1]CAF1613309.1 unnamed protein product [Rotaria sp. Silwood1]CAF1613336.1 unnamed protein product [Rotaria sp. Silwood1]CAF3764862.1 unnamed protein product [Rotaria sp. Silwood1]
MARIPPNQIISLLGFSFDGNFVQSSSISSNLSVPTTDSKLWIIGAVLGPIGFVLLLIGLFYFLHFKCRQQRNGQSSAEVLYNVPQVPSRALNYQTVPNESIQEQAISLNNNIRVLTRNGVLVGNIAPARRLPSIELQQASNNFPQYPMSVDIPMQQIRGHNDAEL